MQKQHKKSWRKESFWDKQDQGSIIYLLDKMSKIYWVTPLSDPTQYGPQT